MRRSVLLTLLLAGSMALGACKGHGKGDGSGGGHGGGGGKKSAKVDDAPAKASAGGKGEGNGEGGGGENEGGDRPTPTADLKIVIAGADGEKTFTGDKLAAMPTSHAPVGDTDTPGWTLQQVLDGVGAKPTDKVVVYGAEDANLILETSDFDPAQAVLFIKLNRSGQLRFRVFRKSGTTWEIGGELRGIDRIELK